MSRFHSLIKDQPQNVLDLNLPPNMACVLRRAKIIDVKPIPLPILQPDGVLVKVVATGICGSDVHNFSAGGVGGRPPAENLVMGHESAGEVIAVGELVTTHKVGDRVAIEPALPCRRCVNCKAGRANICLDIKYCGAPGSVGSLVKFHALPADMAPHLPDNVSWEEAGSIQPLAVGMHIATRLRLGAHQTVAIFGVGPIGLIAGAVAHAYSARLVIGFDINPERVKFAKSYLSPMTGRPIFDHVFLTSDLPEYPISSVKGSSNGHANGTANGHSNGHAIGHANGHAQAHAHDHNDTSHAHVQGPAPHHRQIPTGDHKWEWAKQRVAGWLKQAGLAAEGGVDKVAECSGAEDGMMYSVALSKQGGTYLGVGLSHQQTHAFPTLAVSYKEMDVMGITRVTSKCFHRALDMISRGVVDLKSIITASYPLAESQQAFEAVEGGRELKVIIRNQEA